MSSEFRKCFNETYLNQNFLDRFRSKQNIRVRRSRLSSKEKTNLDYKMSMKSKMIERTNNQDSRLITREKLSLGEQGEMI